jgi:hypothetical protein
VTGGWRKLHNEELHNLYSLPSIIRMMKSGKMRWVGHVARMGEKRNAYRLLMGNSEGKRQWGRQRCSWVDDVGSWRDRIRGFLTGLVWLRMGTRGGLL